jgi:Asp-tRNA(Asn)/Glu-tRNA(Gln) amidotransferase A subunit family amidase
MQTTEETRRRFLTFFSGIGLGGTLLPGVLWAQIQRDNAQTITPAMLSDALALSGLSFGEEDQKTMLRAANQNLTRFEELRQLHIPNDVSPPFYFSPIVPGMEVNRIRQPLHFSSPHVRRPANLEETAFWSINDLAQLIKARHITSVELTEMYLARLHKYNEKLNCVVTFLDDLAMEQAKQADAEIASGKHRGPLHGIPWGAKDIITVTGYKTTWGSGAYKDQMLDEEASIVEMLRDAGAVLLAKLSSGELASGDHWFGGQTKNPWNFAEGSNGSSAGPGSATAAGLVGFSIGSETSGSILYPSARCGATGLRPTFGRVSRYGVMALAWTQDRLGPITRYSEDCALVMSVIARPDGRDLSVSEIPFNWNSTLDIRKLRVGYLAEAFDETKDPLARQNEKKALDQVSALGLKLVPVKLPDQTVDMPNLGVEPGVFFDELIRSGRDKEMTNPARANGFRSGRLIPAVEYLQYQRARMMMMMKLAEATADVDIYLTPAFTGGGVPATADAEAGSALAAAQEAVRKTASARHFTMANLAGYPAVSVPAGFTGKGSPTAIYFYARPFGETELLALTKAWQDATGFHLKRPNLDAAVPSQPSAM